MGDQGPPKEKGQGLSPTKETGLDLDPSLLREKEPGQDLSLLRGKDLGQDQSLLRETSLDPDLGPGQGVLSKKIRKQEEDLQFRRMEIDQDQDPNLKRLKKGLTMVQLID